MNQTANKINSSTYLTEYTNYMTEQNKSPNTINSYVKDINLFFEYFGLVVDESPILSRDQIVKYKDYMLKVKNMNAKSVNRGLSSLKSYNEFLIKYGYMENLVVLSIDHMKIQQSFTSPTNITKTEEKIFLSKLEKYEPYRNYAIATVISNVGLRISEVLDIKIDGLILGDNEIIIIGKGNKQRDIIINNKAVQVIKEYINNHRCKSNYADKCEYLFISKKGSRLDTGTIERIFNKYSNKITPHSLRHRFSSSALEDGVLDIRQLQQQLGHARLDTVMVYTHPTKEKMKSKLNGFSVG